MPETEEERKAREAKEAEQRSAAEAAKKADHERIAKEAEERATKRLLAELGVDDPKKAKDALAAHKKAEEEKLSEAERSKKAVEDALEARGKAEESSKSEKAKREAAEKARDDAVEASRRVKFLASQGFKPSDIDIALFLYDGAKTSLGDKFVETDWAKSLQKERPYLFGQAAPTAPANTTPGLPPPAGRPPASPFGGITFPPANPAAGDAPDSLLHATPEQFAAHERSMGLSRTARFGRS